MATIIVNPFQKRYFLKKYSRTDLLKGWSKRHVIDHNFAYKNEKEYNSIDVGFKGGKEFSGLSVRPVTNLQDKEWSLYLEVDYDNILVSKIETYIQVSGKYGFSDSFSLTILKQIGNIILSGNPGFTTSDKPIAKIEYGCIVNQLQGNGEHYNFILTSPFCFHKEGVESALETWCANGDKPFTKDVFISKNALSGQYNVSFNLKLKGEENADFKEYNGDEIAIDNPPEPEWDLSFSLSSQHVQIAAENMKIGILNVEKTSNNEYELPLKISGSTPDDNILFYDIDSTDKEKYCNSFKRTVKKTISIPVYLKGGVIKNLSHDYISPVYTICIDDGNVKKEIRLILSSNPVLGEDDCENVLLTANDSFGYGYPEQIKIYRGMKSCFFQLNLSSSQALKNVSIELQKGSMGRIQKCLMPLNGSINREKNKLLVASVSDKQKIVADFDFGWPPNDQVYTEKILLRSDFCWDTIKEIEILPTEKEIGFLEIKIEPIYSKQNVYIGGEKSIVGTVSIVNKNLSQTTNREVANDISVHNLRLVQAGNDGNDEDLTFLSIIDLKGDEVNFEEESDLSPMEKREYQIQFLSDSLQLFETYVQFRIVCDNWMSNNHSLSIHKRICAERGSNRWIPNGKLQYKLGASYIEIGTIELSASKEHDSNIYINRREESAIIDNVKKNKTKWSGCFLAPKFYFLDGNQEVETIDISSLKTPKQFPVICRFDSWLNEDFASGWIPIRYCCKDFEDEDNGQSFQISAFKEEPILGIFDDKNLEIAFENGGYILSKDYKYDKTLLEFESSEIICLHLRNKALTPYEEKGMRYGIEISSISNSNSSDIISIPQIQEPVFIQNGTEDYLIPISIDWEKYVEGGKQDQLLFNIEIKYNINKGHEETVAVQCEISMFRESIDNWYSLDLGTTGIVVAKWLDNNLEVIDIDPEQDFRSRTKIEKDANIMSSIVATFEGNGCTDIILNPDYSSYMRDTQDVFVPIKFIIGQKHVPFLRFSEEKSYLLFNSGTAISGKELLPDKIVTDLYQYIFSLLKRTLADNERLILTYPNTYVPEQINKIKSLMKLCYPEINLNFVSESDAVVSYYVNKKSQNEGFPKLHRNGCERILIYDMGAGTLDISYIVLTLSEENEERKYNVDIQKRVGLPVGGNLLDSIIFDLIKKEAADIAEIESEEDESKKRLSLRKYKTWISNHVKTEIDLNKQLKDIKFENREELTECKVTIQELYQKDELRDYLTICTETIFCSLLGNDWKSKIDTFVLSGRAAQYKPLYSKIESDFGDKLDKETISSSEYKICVASGALHYCRIFEDEPNYHFSIANRNQYLNVGLLYNVDNGFGGTKKHYLQLFDLSDPSKQEGVEWSSPENGTQYMLYENEIPINLEKANKITFIQTILNENEVKNILDIASKDGNSKLQSNYGIECFMNELFEIIVPNIRGVVRSKSSIYIKIDKNNNILVKLNKNKRPLEYGNENVELNEFYKKSFWPFINRNV